MTRKFRWMGLAGLVALMAAAAACGEEEKQKPAPSPCEGVICTGDSVCDPEQGSCVCGDGGMECLPGTVCTLDPSPTCVSDRCEFTTCTNGQGCDPVDGLCKCAAGLSCNDSEQCIEGQCVVAEACEGVVCNESESCDPADGSCKCGDGPGCGFGQMCDAGVCKEDRCAGNPCGNGLTCSQEDGLCHCGGETGPVCSGGEACVVGEEGASCEATDLCADAATRCGAGTTCDRDDGSCRCGGVGEGAPVCTSGQTCDDGRCVGGELCLDEATRCVGGTSCDPEDGLCKCGGLFGDICSTEQVCLNHADGATSCVQSCNPLTPAATDCSTGEACYYNEHATGGGQRFCASAGNIPVGSTCRAATDCNPGNHCDIAEGAAQGKCAAYCDVSERPQCGGAGFCAPLDSDIEDLGFCVIR